MKDFLRSHWKKLLGIAVGVAGVFYPPLLPLSTSLGGLIAGSDFQTGAQLGTPVGSDAKKLVAQVRAVLPKTGVIVMPPKDGGIIIAGPK